MKFYSIFDLQKSYTEGIYIDNPKNRKLGRVGMSYSEYKQKEKGEPKFNIQNDDNVLNINLELNNKKVGYIKCNKDDEEKIYYLDEIKIDKDYRKFGFGKLLMNKFISEVKKDKKYKNVVLQVEAEETDKYSNLTDREKIKKINHNLAKNFYFKFGFKYQLPEDKEERSPLLELKLK